jgi:tRNA (guanine37-N1)-methyltransferase
MNIFVVTLFPSMFSVLKHEGVVGRAFKNDVVHLHCINPRDFARNSYGQIDDRPYGGGPGMVMQVEPLNAAIQAAEAQLGKPMHKVCLSPQGRLLDQQVVDELSQAADLLLVCGRYEGIDERLIRHHQLDEVSIGDYVLSGGELAAMVMIDAMVRQQPGVLGHADSAREDSFQQGLLDYPHFTRPENALDQCVPEVLLSGDHQKIQRWRQAQALWRTKRRRPGQFQRLQLSAEQLALMAEIPEDKIKLNH